VTELAKQFYLSESALRSRFKEEIGVPINEYVNKRKIEESKMMIWSGIPAGEIARRLSFYDLSHYYRTFKKYTGVTPQQFRDTNIIGQEM
jgi:AraC-like DNA-binding protein